MTACGGRATHVARSCLSGMDIPGKRRASSNERCSVKRSKIDKQALRCALYMLVGMLLALAIVVAGFGGFRAFGRAAKFARVMRLVKSHFVGDYDPDEAADTAMSGIIASQDDRWSYYMDAEDYAAYQDTSANRYQGIGVTITKDAGTGGFLIVTINKDGPAQRAGLQAGDIILAVDGVDVTAGDTEDLRALIQADYGKDALVRYRSADGGEHEAAVSCQTVYTSPVNSQLLDGHVGYVDIDNFRQGAGQEAIDAIEALLEQGADSLVFDVRSDPGGQVSELVELLDYLLPEGDLFIQTDKRGHESIDASDEDCLEMPMAVLVNADSYSAAEFFAAALRDYDWAVVVGQHTTGKARSQVTYPLLDGSAVHLSQYSYLTPSRTDLYEAGGLAPDVEAALDEEQTALYQTGWLEPAQDAQVRAAIDALVP